MELHKTWVLQNSRASPFPDDTRLVLRLGPPHGLGPWDGVHVGPIPAGQEFSVTVPLVAPAENRAYRSCWILQSRSAGTTTSSGGQEEQQPSQHRQPRVDRTCA